MIQREVFDWGVQLTTRPFEGEDARSALTIRAEISLPRHKRGCTVKITFSGVTASTPLDLLAAQTWVTAMNATVLEAQSVIAEMKAAEKSNRKK